MDAQPQQFRVLYRAFLLRVVDLELLSTQGELHKLLSQIAALLAAFGFVLTLFKVPQYFFAAQRYTRAQILVAAWSDQEFLISTTLAVGGLLIVLMWDNLFPDQRDCLVLAPLPIRKGTVFAAKVAAAGTALGLGVVSLNVFTGAVYPFLVIPENANWLGPLRSLAAFWLTITGASVFLFCVLLSVQGIALHVLRHNAFLRFSSYLQVAALFLVISIYFLMPPLANPHGLTAPETRIWLKLIPSFWFLGLFQQLNGGMYPAFRWLAERALWALAVSVATAATVYLSAYRNHVRRIGEQAGIAPPRHRSARFQVAEFAARIFFRRPPDQAVFLFIARTLARSRPHRTLLAFYCGVGLVCSQAYLANVVYSRNQANWTQASVPLLAAGLVLLFFIVLGMRVCFALPVALRANWIFQTTEMQTLAQYREAVRKSMLLLGPLPLCIALAVVYLSLWPWRAALAHLTVLSLTAILLVEICLARFQKIPFTCSYLPGKSNLKMKLGAYAILFFFFADIGVRVEFWCMSRPGRFLLLIGALLCAIGVAVRRNSRAAALPENRLLFEEAPKAELLGLGLG